MDWLKELFDFLYKNWKLVCENWYLFVTFAIICIGITLLINKCINSYQIRKIEKLTDEITELKEKLQLSLSENSDLKEVYKKYGVLPLLMMGTNDEFSVTSAQAISNKVNK